MKKEDIATIEDIKPDFKKSLGTMEKKGLLELIESEFDNQRSVFQRKINLEKKQHLDFCRKTAKFDVLKEKLDVLRSEDDRIDSKHDAEYSNSRSKERKDLLELEAKYEKDREEIKKKYVKAREANEQTHKLAAKAIAAKISKIKITIHATGFNTDGDLVNPHVSYSDSKEIKASKAASQAIRKDLDEIEKQSPATNLKNKIMAQLLLCSNQGDAMIIVRQVMGNGVIPTISKAEMKQITTS